MAENARLPTGGEQLLAAPAAGRQAASPSATVAAGLVHGVATSADDLGSEFDGVDSRDRADADNPEADVAWVVRDRSASIFQVVAANRQLTSKCVLLHAAGEDHRRTVGLLLRVAK